MKKIMVIAAAAMVLSAAVSCEKYEDGRPSKDVRAEFSRMYPDAWDIEWEFKGNMWEVSFETGTRPNGIDNEARFDMNGKWLQTVTDVYLASVPQNIREYFKAPEFASGQFRDDDADYVQIPDGNWYRFDIRLDGKDVEVDVTEDGKVSQSTYGFW